MTVLKSYKSALMGVKAEIAVSPRGFRMVLTDTDANEVVGVRIFPTMDMADAYAQECAVAHGYEFTDTLAHVVSRVAHKRARMNSGA